jgi:hypothetical protein
MCSHDSPIYVISYANKKGIYASTLPSEILKDFLQIQLLLAQSSYPISTSTYINSVH